MKILIVDDEPLVRRGLISTLTQLKDEFGITDMTEASNGLKAVEFLKENRYDLVFTDIKMPQLDGIELLHWLSGSGLSPSIAVLSCYDDYIYVREAFRNNVLDYILKYDIDIQIIRDLLKKAETSRQNANMAAVRQAVDETDYGAELQENLFTRVYRIVINSGDAGQDRSKSRTLLHRIAACLNITSTITVWPLTGGAFLCIVQEALKDGFMKDTDRLSPLTSGQDLTLDTWGISIGMSRIYKGKRYLREQISESENALSFSFFTGPGHIHDYNSKNWTKFTVIPEHAINFDKKTVIDHLMLKNVSLAKKSLYKLIISYKSALSAPTETIRKDLLELFDLCRMYLIEDQTAAKPAFIREMRDAIEHAAFLDTIVKIFDTFFLTLEKTSLPLLDGKNISTGIKRAVSYIHANYCSTRLSLAAVAKYLKYSLSYLSRQFKKETGSNIVTYINDLRLTEARRLMKTGKFLIYEIADMVGYNNYNYFSKLYKEHFGSSPAKNNTLF